MRNLCTHKGVSGTVVR